MLPDLGKYAATVLSAYGVSIGLIVVLVIWTLRRGSKVRASLREVEMRGRSGEAGASGGKAGRDG